VHEEAVRSNQNKIKMNKNHKELSMIHYQTFSKICNMSIYYANTADLISDYLRND
jgi:hypothetical protein